MIKMGIDIMRYILDFDDRWEASLSRLVLNPEIRVFAW